MQRAVVFVRIPHFGIAVERVCRPGLRDRPLLIAPPGSARALVQDVSPEARQAGILPGMRLSEALRMCRDAEVIHPNPPLYARAEAAILNILHRYTPCIEPRGFGAAYLDVSTVVRLFGGASDIAYRAEREIREALKLPPTAGLAINKLVSAVAARRSPPCDLIQVRPGDEEPFLAPLEVRLLPAVDRNTDRRLQELNLRIIRQLTEIAPRHLETALGRKGLILLRQAKGVDYSPVTPPSATPHVTRRAEPAEDTNDIGRLRCELFHLVEESLSDLRRCGRAARRLQIEILYSDLKSARGAQRLRGHSNRRSVWIPEAEKLLLRILTRRIRVRALEVRFEDFSADPQAQLGLFGNGGDSREVRLERALDELKRRFGGDAVRFARAV